jgi:hypothetical protein
VNPWKRLNKFNSDLVDILAPTRHNGRFAVSKGDKLIMAVLAPLLVIFFAFVIASLPRILGNGYVDKVVRVFLGELLITFLIFTVLAFIYCFFQPKWLEWLLETAVGKIVLVIEFIYLATFMVLIAGVMVNLLGK